MDNHEATQHEFVRRALRFFYEDLPEGEYDGSEDDLREYAATINEGHGYNLDTQLAALTAERDALRALVQRVNEIGPQLTDSLTGDGLESSTSPKLTRLLADCKEVLK